MRVTVLGAGAVGGWLAAGLARAGVPVAVLARGATLAALRKTGLTLVQGETREGFPVTASDDPADLPTADILLLGLKSHDLPAALPLVQRLLGPDTLVATAQNGLPWCFLQGFGGPAEGLVLDSVVDLRRGAGPGHPRGARAGRRRACRQPRRGAGRSAADEAGPDALRRSLRPARRGVGGAGRRAAAWRHPGPGGGGYPPRGLAEFWGNSNMNPLSALCRADMLAMLDDPGVAGLIEAMMREMAAISAGIGLPIERSIPERLVVTRRLGAFRTSMLQDLEAGRALELGPVLGCLVELAQRLEMPAPMLAGIHGLVRLLERTLRPGVKPGRAAAVRPGRRCRRDPPGRCGRAGGEDVDRPAKLGGAFGAVAGLGVVGADGAVGLVPLARSGASRPGSSGASPGAGGLGGCLVAHATVNAVRRAAVRGA